jgi:membrane protease YdiL (CAAX protease family)
VLSVWALHNALLLPWENHRFDEAVREPALLALRAVVWMLPVVLYLNRHEPRPQLVALAVRSRINRRGLALSALGAAVYLCLICLLVQSTAAPGDRPSVLGALGRVQTFYMLLKCTLEELLLRGFLLGQLVRFTSSLRAQALVASLFGLMHLPGWLALEGPQIWVLPSLISLMVLGAVLGGVARASNSILPAIVVHFAANMVQELLGGG